MSWKSPEPIPIAEIPTLGIDFEIINATGQERVRLINERLGLQTLTCAPVEYRLENSSFNIALHTAMSDWHLDGRDDSNRPDSYVLGQPFATDVLIIDGIADPNTLTIGGRYDNLNQRAIRRMIEAELAHITPLDPNIYYLLPAGTFHRRPPTPIDDDKRRIFGRRLDYRLE